VALVGYTNAGKSTLMHRLTGADVLIEDRLFATLDPTVRRMRLPGGSPALLVDTVGFIHKLPHQLIEAFKSTLEQVTSATVLLHVADVSHPGWREHVRVVDTVLGEIGAAQVPTWFAFNKCDRADAEALPGRTELEQGSLVSAARGDGIESLLGRIETLLEAGLVRVEWEIPASRGDVLAAVRRGGRLLEERSADGRLRITALIPAKLAGQLRESVREGEESCS
jgi:GTP-binding protein HflX